MQRRAMSAAKGKPADCRCNPLRCNSFRKLHAISHQGKTRYGHTGADAPGNPEGCTEKREQRPLQALALNVLKSTRGPKKAPRAYAFL